MFAFRQGKSEEVVVRGMGRGGFGRHRGEEFAGEHGMEGGRRGGRIFGHGDIRLVLLALLAEKSAHGYELIKAIEEKLRGAYAPSPGLVYPTLTLLEEMGFASSEEQADGKRLYAITREGKSFLKAQHGRVDEIRERMQYAAAMQRRSETPEIQRAMENLKMALRLKLHGQALSHEQVRGIAAVLDEAVRKIEEC